MEVFMSHKWTYDDQEYLRKHYPTEDTEELAQHFGVTFYSIESQAKKLRLHKVKGVRRNIGYQQKLKSTYHHVMPYSIKEKLGYYSDWNDTISL
jgi:hypothetical protein